VAVYIEGEGRAVVAGLLLDLDGFAPALSRWATNVWRASWDRIRGRTDRSIARFQIFCANHEFDGQGSILDHGVMSRAAPAIM